MCREGASVSVAVPDMFDDSGVEAALMDGWDRLADRENSLEQRLQNIEQSVLEKYPDANVAEIVMSAVILKDDRTLLRRYAALIRMKKRACQLLDSVNREIASAQQETRRELDEVNQLLEDTEEQIGKQARKRRASAVNLTVKRPRGEQG